MQQVTETCIELFPDENNQNTTERHILLAVVSFRTALVCSKTPSTIMLASMVISP